MNALNSRTQLSIRIFLALSGMLAHAQSSSENTRDSVTNWLTNRTAPAVIAHRGCWQSAPENSLKGIRTCISLGVDMVEGDVRTTKDVVLVLMHDPTLERMTNKTGTLSSYTYQELNQARLRNGSGGKDATLTEETIPSLSDALRTAKGHLFLLLHINDADVDRVFDVVSAAGAQGDVVFLWDASPDSSVLNHAKFIGRSAFIPIIFLCTSGRTKGCYTDEEFRAGKVIADYQRFHPVGYLTASDDSRFLKTAATAEWRSKFKVMANQGEDHPEESWAQDLQWKVSMILTDHAKPLVEYLQSKRAR